MSAVDRRTFLKATVAVAAAAGAGCRRLDASFPQGVASGDPRPDRVLLWTRVVVEDADEVEVRWEVATDDSFSDVVAEGQAVASAADDFTVRVLASGLAARTSYRYRFLVGTSTSPTGVTRTAPAPDDDVPVRVALASCQDYVGRWYHAYRALLEEDSDVELVVFLGDYIYETVADPRHQEPTPERSVSIPDGLALSDDPDNLSAVTLADYRALYRQIRTDPDLMEVHRRLPFVIIWDDHEHANDVWQDVTNEFDGARGEEVDTARREAATRAWFEYLPVDVPFRPDAGFPDDVVTYRSLRFGKHLELFCSDCRYYRDDHVVPEDEAEPLVGKLTAPSPMGSRVLATKEGFDTLEAEARPTMLGAEQLQWLIDGIRSSDATFKAVVSPLMMAQMVLDLTEEDEVSALLRNVWYFKLDQWDGYRSERQALLEAVADVPGVVVLSGDLHGAYASVLRPDFDDPDSPATAVEITVTGISSIPLAAQLELFVETDPLLASLELGEVVGRFDEVLVASSPHYVHADGRPYGYGVCTFSGQGLDTDLVETSDAKNPTYGGVVERVRWHTPVDASSLLPR